MERVLRRLLIFSILFGLLAPALLAVDYLVVFDESSTVRIYDANTFQLLGSPAVGPNGLRAFGIPDPTNPTALLKIDGYPVDSGSPNILWFGDFLGFCNRVNNHLVSRRIHGYRLLDEPIEEFAAAFGFAAVETEGELVQV